MTFQIRELKLNSHFDVIVVSGDLKWEKPQAEIFHRACQKLGVEPYECLIVGDKLETDIEGGFKAQLGITVWVNDGQVGQAAPKPPPDFTIPEVSELIQILQGGKDKNKAAKNVRPKKNSTSNGPSTSAGASAQEPAPSTSSGASAANKSSSPEPEDA